MQATTSIPVISTADALADDTRYALTPEGLAALEATEREASDAAPAALPEGLAEPDEAAPHADFYPNTQDGVDWVLRKIAQRRNEAALVLAQAEKSARQLQAEAAFFEWKYGPALQAYLRAELDGGRRKSLVLPHGTLGFRSKPAAAHINDDKAALDWAKANQPEAVVERIDKAAIGKALLASGEVVEFATLTPAEEKFYIG